MLQRFDVLHTHCTLEVTMCSMIEVAHTFPLKTFLSDRVPEPKIVGMSILFRKKLFSILGSWDYSSGCELIFAEVSFSGEEWNSLREEPQKIQGESLS